MRKIGYLLCLIVCLTAASCGGQEPAAAPVEPTATPTEEVREPTASPQPADTPTPSGPLGFISGKLMPMSEDLPSPTLRVYARDINTGWMTYVEMPSDQTEYTLSGIPEGVYAMVGWYYPSGQSGAYTDSSILLAETSSDQFKCNTSLTYVELKPGQMEIQGIDIACWGGDFYYLLTPMP
jgi:hypothetical protein